jgi:hypothetical protein
VLLGSWGCGAEPELGVAPLVFLFCEAGFCCVAQAGQELAILLAQPPDC